MESELHSIGELARASGLGVGTLRYYDGAEVLTPAWVDPRTGYRWYRPGQLADARLLARLRRVGLPLAGIRAVLGAAPGGGEAARVLDAHLRRLEDGLVDARRELSVIRAMADQREQPMTTDPADPGRTVPRFAVPRFTVPADGLAAALDAVRFAVGDDPDLPALAGVLFEPDGPVLRLVATDRYRMAFAEAPATGDAPEQPVAGTIVPTPLVDALRALLGPGATEVALTLGGGLVRAEAGGHRVEGAAPDLDYPDHRAVARLEPEHRVTLPAADLRAAVETGATRTLPSGPHGADCEVTVLTLTGDGRLTVAADPAPEDVRLAVNRDFLLDALAAGRPEQLVLELGGPIAPLAIRTPGRTGTFSVLMPVRLP
ncbi:MerR family transcriptional regulator [Kitasatospora sp. NPDC086791]|uniref:DNA polymerase III subunit beta family protein n=1 Tax=Kitasatospora sp. NPDC086791 TaxID=3155178 RepID=UPI0034407638